MRVSDATRSGLDINGGNQPNKDLRLQPRATGRVSNVRFHLQPSARGIVCAQRRDYAAMLGNGFAHASGISYRNGLSLRRRQLIAYGLVERAQHGVAASGCDDRMELQIGVNIG